MKSNRNLTRYIICENGDVFNKSDGTQVMKVNKEQYKLVTDDLFTSQLTKRTTNVVRRFTVDQIAKLWKDNESIKIDESGPGVVQENINSETIVEVAKGFQKLVKTSIKKSNRKTKSK